MSGERCQFVCAFFLMEILDRDSLDVVVVAMMVAPRLECSRKLEAAA